MSEAPNLPELLEVSEQDHHNYVYDRARGWSGDADVLEELFRSMWKHVYLHRKPSGGHQVFEFPMTNSLSETRRACQILLAIDDQRRLGITPRLRCLELLCWTTPDRAEARACTKLADKLIHDLIAQQSDRLQWSVTERRLEYAFDAWMDLFFTTDDGSETPLYDDGDGMDSDTLVAIGKESETQISSAVVRSSPVLHPAPNRSPSAASPLLAATGNMRVAMPERPQRSSEGHPKVIQRYRSEKKKNKSDRPRITSTTYKRKDEVREEESKEKRQPQRPPPADPKFRQETPWGD